MSTFWGVIDFFDWPGRRPACGPKRERHSARKRASYGVLTLLLLFLATPLLAETTIPPLQARVTDQAGVLDAAARQALEAKLAAFEQRKGSQIAVLIVPSTLPESIEQYSIRVVDAWKLGRKGIDDGVLLLLAMQDRSLRIEVGRGLEGAIPDAIAKRVIAEVMTPYFKRGDFAGGIDAGVAALIKVVDGEPLPEPATTKRDSSSGLGEAAPTLLIAAVVLGGILRMVLGPLLGAGVAGTLAFIAGWLVLGSLAAGLIVAVIAFLFTLLRGVGGGFGGRGGGGFGGGGFGGGGFGGGGGGFGGGGASGRW